ncbi:hypothetical protein Brsp01_44080 [Brucella sp. NBRC 12950]|jgi:hypothetical protein|nr:hypothetical protein Brsp01_44080 [Brucella sp. NBRC 12950]
MPRISIPVKTLRADLARRQQNLRIMIEFIALTTRCVLRNIRHHPGINKCPLTEPAHRLDALLVRQLMRQR